MADTLAMDEAPVGRLHVERLALDRASVRTYDEFGRLHVKVANISKANICPYYGREIPGAEQMGLEPNRIYRLLRCPEELAKAAATANNIPLLDQHLRMTADEPQKENIVGSTGTDATFTAPYLSNSLVVWSEDGIADVEAETKRELSCSYRYRADMTPGVHEGEPYDGVMRDIVFNHVAIVPEGRAGSDVLIGDAALPAGGSFIGVSEASLGQSENRKMIKTQALSSRKALMVQGALAAFLAPKLAADAQIDIGPALRGVDAKNYGSKKATIASRLQSITKGKLAADADLGEVAELLEQLEDVQSVGEDCTEAKDAEETDEEKAAKTASDAEEDDKDAAAKDESEEDKDKAVAKDEEPAEEKVTKEAMDAAIASAVRKATKDTIASLNAIQAAKEAVRPHIGEISGKVGSAAEVYRMALDSAIDAGVDINLDGVPTSAYPALVSMLPVPGAEAKRPTQRPLAQDAAAAKGFMDRYPGAARIRQL